jgi:four helix bundle protein
MSSTSDYRDLVVWQKGIELAKVVYSLTQKFPPAEKFGLTSQMRRAAVSIPSNIAEGNARQSRRDYVHYLIVARGSLAELDTQLVIARELKMISDTDPLRAQIQEMARTLQSLIRRLRDAQEDS